MPKQYTKNLDLVMPGRDNQYNVDDFNENMQKLDDFAGEVPLATKARQLNTPRNINGVTFDGTQNIITGLGLYSANEVYAKGNIVYYYDDFGVFYIYKSLQDNNLGNEVTNTLYWEEQNFGLPTATLQRIGGVKPDGATINILPDGSIYVVQDVLNKIGEPIITLNNMLYENEIWLEGATVSRETYAELFAIYGTTYGAGDGSTTFTLPDFRNRAIWGSDSFGYLSAGLPSATHTHTRGTMNITGTAPYALYVPEADPATKTNGCITMGETDTKWWGRPTSEQQSSAFFTSFKIDASKNWTGATSNNSSISSIYGGSTTVQPPAIKVRVKTRYR